MSNLPTVSLDSPASGSYASFISFRNTRPKIGFYNRVRNGKQELPPDTVSALPGHFEKVLLRASEAGMVLWKDPCNDSMEHRDISAYLTMSSFAVVKDQHEDRLISWPRTANMFLIEPPDVDLPCPTCFNAFTQAPPRVSKGFLWTYQTTSIISFFLIGLLSSSHSAKSLSETLAAKLKRRS